MRTHGKLGYSEQAEVAPGKWEEVVTEVEYLGDVVQRTEAFVMADSVLPGYRTSTSVSVLSGGVEKVNYADLRYITWAGRVYTVASAVMNWPRLVVYLGEEYHGPLAAPDAP